jgi:hypothetical protein
MNIMRLNEAGYATRNVEATEQQVSICPCRVTRNESICRILYHQFSRTHENATVSNYKQPVPPYWSTAENSRIKFRIRLKGTYYDI